MLFRSRGDNIGIDAVGDLVDTAESVGLLSRTGALYQLDDGTKVQGRDGIVNRIKEDLDLQQQLKDKLSNV